MDLLESSILPMRMDINKINEILSNPDNVYLETKKENTLWLIKKYDQNVKITLKLQENIKIQLFRCK